MGFFLDIKAVFDSITPELIRGALIRHGCNPDMAELYYELSIHRNLSTTYENILLEITNMGGVCSAKFWIIVFDEAASILNSNGVSGELFTDNGNGIIGGTDIEYMAQSLNRVCRDLSNWGRNAA